MYSEQVTTASCDCIRSNACPALNAGECACTGLCGVSGCGCGESAARNGRPQTAARGGAVGPMHADEDKTPRPGAEEAVQAMGGENTCESFRNPELPFMAEWGPRAFAAAGNAASEHSLVATSPQSSSTLSDITKDREVLEEDGAAGDTRMENADDRQMELPFMADWEPTPKSNSAYSIDRCNSTGTRGRHYCTSENDTINITEKEKHESTN